MRYRSSPGNLSSEDTKEDNDDPYVAGLGDTIVTNSNMQSLISSSEKGVCTWQYRSCLYHPTRNRTAAQHMNTPRR